MPEPELEPDPRKTCPECGARFECAVAAGKERCWCFDLPPLPGAPDPKAACLCPTCLKARIAARGESADPN